MAFRRLLPLLPPLLLGWISLAPVLLAAAAGNAAAAAVVVDLSRKDLEESDLVNASPGAVAVTKVAAEDPLIRAAVVLEDGRVVSRYVRDGVDRDEPFQAWSTTKSWTSLLVGLLVDDGLVSVNETLGEIFVDDATWANVTDAGFRKNVTVHELLTMSSGLVSPPSFMDTATPEDLENLDPAMLEAQMAFVMDGGSGGGANLTDSLAYPAIGAKGEFSYLGISNIMSYVIQSRDPSQRTPREYLAERVLPALGIEDGEISWWKNMDGVEYAYHGLELTAAEMAKFGQLYLQGGKSSPDVQLVSESWVNQSLTRHLTFTTELVPGGPPFSASYGYLFWSGGEEDGGSAGIRTAAGIAPNVPDDVWCAIGAYGQDICISPSLGRVVASQRDSDPADLMGASSFLVIAPTALDPSLSFNTKAPETSPPADSDGENVGDTASGGIRARFPSGVLLLPVIFLLRIFD